MGYMIKNTLIIGIILVVLSTVLVIKSDKEKPVNQKSEEPNEVLVSSNKIIDLSNQNLEKIPNSIFTKTDTEELDVSNNSITGAIQGEIRFLSKLKKLDASNNLMTGVPAEVGQLQNLEVLDLSNNNLTGLPYELGNLKNLKVLNLSGNQYSKQDLEIIRGGLSSTVEIIVD